MWNDQAGYDNHGGGFMNSQSGSQPGSSAPKKSYKKKCIIPCSIGRLLSATHEDDSFLSNGVELSQLSVSGLVVKAEESNNFHLYTITDMSGPALEVRNFVDTEDTARGNTLIPINTYVHVFGNLRSFGNKRSMTAFKIRPIKDFNQLTSHLLECMFSQVYKGKKEKENNPVNPVNSNMTSGGGDQDMGLTKNQTQVLNCIKSCMEDHGMTINDVTNKLKGLPKNQIMEAIEFLSNEGHVYSTIDDDHFKATDI